MLALARVIAAVAVLAALVGGGYRAGYSRADAGRVAEVATLKAQYAGAQAEAERAARERLEEEVNRADALAVQLAGTKRELAAKTKDITRRIRDAARSAAGCSFGPDFVQLYNEALGYPRGAAVPESAGAPGADHGAGPASAPFGGVLPGRTVTAPVTPEDLLAHARDFGAWARELEAQLRALGAFVKEGR